MKYFQFFLPVSWWECFCNCILFLCPESLMANALMLRISCKEMILGLQLTRHVLLLCLESWNLVRFSVKSIIVCEEWNVMPWSSYHEGWLLSGISNTSRLPVSPPGRGCRSPNEAQLNIQTNEVRAQNRTQPSHLMLRMLSEIGRNIDYLSSSDTWHHLYWTPAHCSYQVLHFPFFINHSNIQWKYCEGLRL